MRSLESMYEMIPSPITATVDFQAEGKQHGFLKLPYSHDRSAWGQVMIPVTVVCNGVEHKDTFGRNLSTALDQFYNSNDWSRVYTAFKVYDIPDAD